MPVHNPRKREATPPQPENPNKRRSHSNDSTQSYLTKKKFAAEKVMATEGAWNRSFAMLLTTNEKNNELIPHCRRLQCERDILRSLHIIPNPAAVIGNAGNSSLTLRWNCLLANCHACLAPLRLLRTRKCYNQKESGGPTSLGSMNPPSFA